MRPRRRRVPVLRLLRRRLLRRRLLRRLLLLMVLVLCLRLLREPLRAKPLPLMLTVRGHVVAETPRRRRSERAVRRGC